MSQPTIKQHPPGAICSIAHLQSLIDEGDEIELFYVHGLGKSSSLGAGHFINRRSRIIEGRILHVRWRSIEDYDFSLLDCNVIRLNGYNDHFLFDNRKLAERYLNECLASTLQEKVHREHLAWCDRIFRDWP